MLFVRPAARPREPRLGARIAPQDVTARIRGAFVLLLLAALCTLGASTASASVRLVRSVHMRLKPNGLAVLGSRVAYVGSVYSGDAVNVLRLPGLSSDARWRMPSLGDPLDWTMERMALSADGRWLFVLNQIRQEVAVIDVTGAVPVASIHLASALATDIVPSPNGRLLAAVVPGGPTEFIDVASGQEVGELQGGATAIAWRPGGGLFALFISFHQATLESFDTTGHVHVLASYRGYILAPQTGSIAISPNGRRVYVLYDGLRSYDGRTGQLLHRVPLPYQPGYIGMAISPNGRQAMLWAPDFAQWADTPSEQPGYTITHFGYVPGGVIPIDLLRMRPIRANLRQIGTPWQVGYTSDSRYVVVSERNYHIDLIATGTAGTDRTRYLHVSLANPRGGKSPGTGTGGNGGTGGHGSGTGGTGATCTGWNVQGSWTFTQSQAGGPANGPVTLHQTGNSVSGTLTDSAGTTWTITGTISGATLSLTFTAPLQVTIQDTDSISSNGSSFAGNYGTFTGHAACSG
jgi:hypothetical protein